jgi:hypothetical protein
MQPHLVWNLALLQAVLGQPGIGGVNGAVDVIGGSREIAGCPPAGIAAARQQAERR